uniref:Uncharacterized protein n=2 Tax=Neisseria leonii TaxID=2995413 RepID=A0A9X4IEW7_9NEIS|nr:hypothetical protein [Neisseria sp. 51.81]
MSMKTLSILFVRTIIKQRFLIAFFISCGYLLLSLYFKWDLFLGIGEDIFGKTRELFKASGGDWNVYLTIGLTLLKLLLIALALSFLVAIVIYFLSWPLCCKIIVLYGERASALMEMTSEISNPNREEHNKIFRCMFSFVDVHGKMHKNYFLKSSDIPLPTQSRVVPTHPKDKFVRYPKLGEKFEVLYLKGLEDWPIILNTGDSEFVRHIQEEHRQKFIRQLSERVSKLKILVDADPLNPERQKIYQQAEQDLHNYQQFGTEPMLIEKVGELKFKSNP